MHSVPQHKLCSSLLFAISLSFAATVTAESLSLDSVSECSNSVQKSAATAQQTVDTGKQISTLGATAADVVSGANLTDTLVNKLGISSA
ncbi:hypothetical protein [Bathymodiolus japonicus methanotrophic gill symbiont]|uniref:hypothetical protein n=1 Tax=Bathymodiolus japonicus methanotrophic gill symbiont TaxID=113269 RepID=UPI001C8E9B4E|nr:hypothetical protein [Bathymodiolus japonicus methanotrophic gill symbiont]